MQSSSNLSGKFKENLIHLDHTLPIYIHILFIHCMLLLAEILFILKITWQNVKNVLQFLKETFGCSGLKALPCSAYLLQSEFQRISDFYEFQRISGYDDKMVRTLLLGQKSCIWVIWVKLFQLLKSIPASKSHDFVKISGAQKSTCAKFLQFDFFYQKRQGYIAKISLGLHHLHTQILQRNCWWNYISEPQNRQKWHLNVFWEVASHFLFDITFHIFLLWISSSDKIQMIKSKNLFLIVISQIS